MAQEAVARAEPRAAAVEEIKKRGLKFEGEGRALKEPGGPRYSRAPADKDQRIRDLLGWTDEKIAAAKRWIPAQNVEKSGRAWSLKTIDGESHPGRYDTRKEAIQAAERHKELRLEQYKQPSRYRDIISVLADKRLEAINRYERQGMTEMEAGRRAYQDFPDQPTVHGTGPRYSRGVEPSKEQPWERSERFKGMEGGIATARAILVSQTLGRGFGQSMEDYLAKNPEVKRRHDAAVAYLRDKGVATKWQLEYLEKEGTPRYSYLGRNAALADHSALGEAIALSRAGTGMEDIREKTGWFKPKGETQWRFELSDKDSSLKPGWRESDYDAEKILANVFSHNKLYQNYPALINIRFSVDDLGDTNGYFNPATKRIVLSRSLSDKDARSVLLHEVQHVVQNIERFSGGGSPTSKAVQALALKRWETERAPLTERLNQLGRLQEAWTQASVKDGTYPGRGTAYIAYREKHPGYASEADKLVKQLDDLDLNRVAHRTYRRLLGEVEARDVQFRADMGEEERRLIEPYVSQGIDEKDFIANLKGEGLAESRGESAVRAPAAHTAESLKAELRDTFGAPATANLLRNHLEIVDRDDQLPPGLRHREGGVRGVFDPNTGKSWMVAGNVRKGEGKGLALHEIGTHAEMEKMLGPKLWAHVLGQVEAAAKVGKTNPNASPFVAAVVAAQARLPNDTAARYISEETIAGLVEDPANHNLPLVRRLFAAIRAWLIRQGIPLRNITAADLAQLAAAAVRRVSRGETVRRGQVPAYARAYHGSPHQFEKFDISKIGTGEGAQSYGHGLYFAENPEVANQYRFNLAGTSKAHKFATDELFKSGGDIDKAILSVNDKLRKDPGRLYLLDAKRGLYEIKEQKAQPQPGAIYQVDIPDAQIEKMLDWDKPLSEQNTPIDPFVQAQKGSVESLPSRFGPVLINDATAREFANGKTGSQLYDMLVKEHGPEKASKILKEAGIPGIRYLDHGSRAAGQGTRNFVVFDPSIVTILDRNGEKLKGVEKQDAIEELQAQHPETAADPHFEAYQKYAAEFGTRLAGKAGTTAPLPPRTDIRASAMRGLPLFSRAAQTDTPAFRAWFGESKVVDEQGKPLVVYHGTEKSFTEARTPLFLTEDRDAAEQYADGGETMEVYARVENPYEVTDVEEFQEFLDEHGYKFGDDFYDAVGSKKVAKIMEDEGYDGITFEGDTPDLGITQHKTIVIFHPTQIKSATGNIGTFDPANPDIRYSRGAPPPLIARQDPATQEALRKAGVIYHPPTLAGRVRAWLPDWQRRVKQGLVDAFDPIKLYDQKAYMKARLTKGADAGLEGLLKYGTLRLDKDGAIEVSYEKGGFLGLMKQLDGEHDLFFGWVAGKRAKRILEEGKAATARVAALKDELRTLRAQRTAASQANDLAAYKRLQGEISAAGKELVTARERANVQERNFNEGDIEKLIALSDGKMADGRSRADVYGQMNKELQRYNRSVMDLAEQAGLIDAETRPFWEKDFYVPFYRLMEEEDTKGPVTGAGLIRQYAFKHMKGGKEVLGDPFENTLKNWSHLISASLKNQAGGSALEAAEAQGAAEVTASTTKGAIWVRKAGKPVYYTVSDPLLLDAVKALNAKMLEGPAMKAMTAMKRALTLGVTIAPAFRVRNLLRDTMQAIGTSDLSYNMLGNVLQGWKGTKEGSADFAQLLAGGGVMRFGTWLEGDRAANVKRLIESGVASRNILTNQARIQAMLVKGWRYWQSTGERAENVNRSAIYQQARARGASHLEASYLARDLMDFSMQGTWGAIRMLTQMVPFMNARMQGLYKLGRAYQEDPVRLMSVTGAVAAASIMLAYAYGDDDDWKAREDWDRDNNWWFKIGDQAYWIPKPFEIGAIASMAERGYQALTDPEFGGRDFADRMGAILWSNLSLNPIPQLFKPLVELYANKDTFTDRPIETEWMQKLSVPLRVAPETSASAQVLGKAGVLSPVQIDHLARGYFGWLGSHVVLAADLFARRALGLADRPAWRTENYPLLGDFAKDLPAYQNRYVTKFYDQAEKVQEALGDLKHYRDIGAMEQAKELRAEKSEMLRKGPLVRRTMLDLGKINGQIRRVQQMNISAEAKRARLDRLYQQRNEKAARASRALESAP